MNKFEITHNGEVIYRCQFIQDVWSFLFAKEKEIIKQKEEIGESWDYISIGIHGLTMNNVNNNKERLTWIVQRLPEKKF